MPTIRPERPSDQAAVRELVALAFGQDLQVRLLDGLRASAGYVPELSLVADEGGRVVGHVLLTRTPMLLTERGAADIMMLSPLAVHPDAQGRGYGRALVEAAVETADARGEALVILEGDPAMYRKFGFEPASAYGIQPPSEHTSKTAFQVRTLSAYDPSLRGAVLYPAAIWELDAVGSG